MDDRRSVIEGMVGLGVSHADIATAIGISRQRVGQILKPQRAAARRAVYAAVQRGSLIRPDRCSECGGDGKIEAHHDDYDRPLDVRWLCRVCHAKEHADQSDGAPHGNGATHVTIQGTVDEAGCGIECPRCGGDLGSVTDTRKRQGYIRRRRECSVCGGRSSTEEKIATDADNGFASPMRTEWAQDAAEVLDRVLRGAA